MFIPGFPFLFFFLFVFLSSCQQKNPTEHIPDHVLLETKVRNVTLHYHISDYAKGSGILLNSQGLVLTSLHVIFGWEDKVRVSQDGKTFFEAKVLLSEPKLDLVVLQTKLVRNITPLQFVDRSLLEIDEPIFLWGAAWGLADSFLKGYISHTDRTGVDIRMPEVPFVQTTGTSYPGCSGAGVYLFDGRFVGINRATVGLQTGNGIGLVIPSGYIKVFLERLADKY